MHSKQQIYNLIATQFPFPFTQGQEKALQQILTFISDPNNSQIFILKGYAGTGKTSLTAAIVKGLRQLRQPMILMAPTGRAAKVFSNYTQAKARTIHKILYRVSQKEGVLRFSRRKNAWSNVLFIVDEVSMIGNTSEGNLLSPQSILEDLIQFVCEGDNCKMIFLGDDAQLPPVHSAESPALDKNYLQQWFNMKTVSCQLTEVLRQANDSGILFNANKLRNKIMKERYTLPLFSGKKFPDFIRVSGEELEETLNTLYSRYDTEELTLITRSNKRAYQFNEEIRKRILFKENKISAGDYVMAVKNNYYWIDESSEPGFIANGDIMEILSINKMEELYGFHFANITVRLCDYPDFESIDIKVILESLDSETASLSADQQQRLYEQIALDYQEIANKRLRYLKLKNDPFLNAIQIKFSYSLTCHKTQGGQWRVVLVDQGYIPPDGYNKEYLRWLYTAITRATEKLYLINFANENFEE